MVRCRVSGADGLEGTTIPRKTERDQVFVGRFVAVHVVAGAQLQGHPSFSGAAKLDGYALQRRDANDVVLGEAGRPEGKKQDGPAQHPADLQEA